MVLHNLYIVGEKPVATDIRIQGGKIVEIGPQHSTEESLDLSDLMVFPGLINSHDHLDFNLFPSLGSTYNDYTEWGRDIHIHHKKEIEAVLAIPKLLRIKWGVIKNVLNGVTTVVDHSRIHDHLSSEHINIFSEFTYLHSVALDRFWKIKLNNPFVRRPVMIHVGEGVNKAACEEIDELVRWNLFKRDLIGVHGIAMSEKQSGRFKALVWCPASNFFLYDKTAPVGVLKKHTRILFGTDSTLSASANLWDHLRLARNQDILSDTELYDSMTCTAAEVLKMEYAGKISEGKSADLVIAKKQYKTTIESFYELNPEDIMMIVKGGNIIYLDDELNSQISLQEINRFAPVYINQSRKYLLKEMVNVIEELEELGVRLPLHIRSGNSYG